ncbi:MAG: rhomboid family intramembrane serine protease, partial [Cyclobacteriaceae bacterium]
FFWIYLFTGFWVWIVARDAYHIGASGLVYGLTSFLLFSGFFRKDSKSIAISFIIIFLHSSMVYGLIPGDEAISYESHIMGTLGGLLCAFLYRRSPLKDAPALDLSEVDTGLDLDQDNGFHTTINDPSLQIRYHYQEEEQQPEADSDHGNRSV